jgi:hypothetical protein
MNRLVQEALRILPCQNIDRSLIKASPAHEQKEGRDHMVIAMTANPPQLGGR